MEQENNEIKARISELRARYGKLQALCSYGARMNAETVKAYAEEIQKLQAQLN